MARGARPGRLPCPACGRRIGVLTATTTAGPDGQAWAVLQSHNHPDGRRCPGRVVNLDRTTTAAADDVDQP